MTTTETPVWQMTRHEADRELWAMLAAARLAGDSPPRTPRYRDLGIALQTVKWMRQCCRVLGLPTRGTKKSLLRRIVEHKATEDRTALALAEAKP